MQGNEVRRLIFIHLDGESLNGLCEETVRTHEHRQRLLRNICRTEVAQDGSFDMRNGNEYKYILLFQCRSYCGVTLHPMFQAQPIIG